MATSVSMSYGQFVFAGEDGFPVPSFSYDRTVEKTPGSDLCLSTKINLTLNGFIVPDAKGFGPVSSGIAVLSDTFTCGSCQLFSLDCDEQYLFYAPATVKSLSIEPRNDGDLYVQTAAYSIELELAARDGDVNDNNPFEITAITETWDWQWRDERVGGTVDTYGIFNTGETFNGNDPDGDGQSSDNNQYPPPVVDHELFIASAWDISHSISVTSPLICKFSGPNLEGWINAAERLKVGQPYYLYDDPLNPFVGTRAGVNSLFRIPGYQSGEAVEGQSVNYYLTNLYNHFRNLSVDRYEGTVSMDETWIASNQAALEDFSVTLDQDLLDVNKSITVNGTIQGLIPDMTYTYFNTGENNFGTTRGTPKLQSALDYWSYVKGQLASRARTVYDESFDRYTSGQREINTVPQSRSVGYNTVAGTVTYNYVFSDRVKNCLEEQTALYENISITENEPPDIFSSLTILGRAGGPLYQDIGTIGQRTRSISVESVLPVATGCSVTGGSGEPGTSSGLLWSAPTGYDSLVAQYETYLRDTYDQVFVTNDQKQWDLKTGKLNWNKSFTVGDCQ